MSDPILELGPKLKAAYLRRLLWLPAVVLVLSIGAAIYRHSVGWVSVGGILIAAIGTVQWGRKSFRGRFAASDVPMPPLVHEDQRGPTGLAPVNFHAVRELRERALDRASERVGIVLVIFGGLLGVLPIVWPSP